MSVGLQRLRDEPEVIRQGAIDKGEDPALVDRALELDERRRDAPRRERGPQGGAQCRAASGSARRSRAAPARRSGGRRAQGRIGRGRRTDHRPGRGARRGRSAPSTTSCCASPTRPTRHPGRWRGGQRHRPHVGRDPAQRGRRLGAQAALGAGRDPRHPRQRARRQDRRLRLPGLQGRRVRAPARPDLLVPRRPHPGERLHRGLAAGRREHRQRDRAPGRSRTRKTRCTSSPATSCTWSRRRRSRSPTSIATRSWTRPSCRSATPPTRRASGARPVRPARTRAASCASTSSTRSRWSCSRSPTTRRPRSSG